MIKMKIILSTLTACLFLSTFTNAQAILTSSNLPIIVIDTKGKPIPDEPKIEATMGVIDNGPGKRNNITDPFSGFYGKIGIEIRGQSSTQFPKKQYGIETRDDAGNDIAVPLLGLPEESDWVLNANYLDKTFMRNILAYGLYNDMGRYATRTRFCEVILNNDYVGLYILQEKIKRDKNRVDISKLESTDIAGDDITGGYIVRIDKLEYSDQYWTSPFLPYTGIYARVNYQYYYPNETDIIPEQKKYIKDYVTAFETIMNSSNVSDPFINYLNYIDINSFVDMFIINEFTKATDAYRISAYFYKDKESKGGKLIAGPPWDFDIAFGVANYDQGWDPNGWQLLYKNGTNMENPFWCVKLFNDPMFRNKFVKRWNELKYSSLSTSRIEKLIDEKISEIGEAVARNFLRWKILGTYVWPNKNIFKTFDEEVAYLKNWIKQRTVWFNVQLPDTYSAAEWNERDLSSLNMSVGIPRTFSKTFFIKNSQNITSVDFYCLDANVNLRSTNDSLTITILKNGNYVIKAAAKKDGSTISISPEYKINLGSSVHEDSQIPSRFRLYQNYPNPFNPETTIRYEVHMAGEVSLKIYDVLGNEVKTLVNEYKQPGIYYSTLYTSHSSLTSGFYFYKMQAGNYLDVKKMIVIK